MTLALGSLGPSCKPRTAASRVEASAAVAYPHPDDPERAAIAVVELTNRGPPTGLSGARVEDGKAKIRTHAFDEGRAVTPVLRELALPTDRTVQMRPDGVYVSITELGAPLRPGTRLPIVLLFQDRSELTIEAEARRLPSPVEPAEGASTRP